MIKLSYITAMELMDFDQLLDHIDVHTTEDDKILRLLVAKAKEAGGLRTFDEEERLESLEQQLEDVKAAFWESQADCSAAERELKSVKQERVEYLEALTDIRDIVARHL